MIPTVQPPSCDIRWERMAKSSSLAMPGARTAAIHIVRTLRESGHVAYFAGGCVRDELLGLVPTDYDVATDAMPDRVMALFPRSGEVGKSFGVVLVRVAKEVVEVATFRADGEYADHRRPDSVTFSDPPQDAARRDYTVNALFLDPLATPASMATIAAEAGPNATVVDAKTASSSCQYGGLVIDYVQGLADLAAKRLRAVGVPDQRLAEDHLRALRAVRLACKLGFEIEPETKNAIRRHAAELHGVSRERVGEEVRQMLEHPARARATRLLAELDLEAPVLMLRGNGSGPPLTHVANLTLGTGTPKRLEGLPPAVSFAAALAAWALDIGLDPHKTQAIDEILMRWRRALCLSNDDRDALAAGLRGIALLDREWAKLSVAKQKRAAASPWFIDALAIAIAADEAAGHAVEKRALQLAMTPPGLSPPALLTGDDLVSMGWRPGPGFKRVLDDVYDEQLEGKIRTVEEARELAQHLRV